MGIYRKISLSFQSTNGVSRMLLKPTKMSSLDFMSQLLLALTTNENNLKLSRAQLISVFLSSSKILHVFMNIPNQRPITGS